jgi:hypothetical protein
MLNTERNAWEFLLQKTKLYATGHVARWHWRGAIGGLLPDGFDPESLASEAILEFLQDSSSATDLTPNHIHNIQRDLERRVRRHVNRLHHRIENRLLRNEPDLAPKILEDGESISPIDLIPDPSPSPANALIEKESLARFETAKAQFANSLQRQPELNTMFKLLCDGIEKPRTLSRRMKLPVCAIHNLRKQLRRRCPTRFHK